MEKMEESSSQMRIHRTNIPVALANELPVGRILHVGESYDGNPENVNIWYEAGTTPTPIHVVGTGHPVPPGYVYRGTAVYPEYPLVWHVFQKEDE